MHQAFEAASALPSSQVNYGRLVGKSSPSQGTGRPAATLCPLGFCVSLGDTGLDHSGRCLSALRSPVTQLQVSELRGPPKDPTPFLISLKAWLIQSS